MIKNLTVHYIDGRREVVRINNHLAEKGENERAERKPA